MEVRWMTAVMIAALAGAAPAAAQDVDPTRFEQGVGMAVGAISGSGLSYIFHSDGPWSYQITGGVWKQKEDTDYNAGLLVRRTLEESRNTRFYALVGGALYEGREEKQGGTEVRTHWNTGFGVGVQFFLWNRVGVSVDGDFTFLLNDESIFFLPQVAAQYHF